MRSDTGQQMMLPGETDPSTHYMASMDNYAVPLVQEEYIGGPLNYNDNPPPSSSDFKFDSDDKANYFAKKYKNASAAKVFNEDGGLLPTFMNKRRRPQGILPTMMKTGGKMHRMPNGKMMLNSEHPPTEKYATGGTLPTFEGDPKKKKKDYTSSQNAVEGGDNPLYKVDENGAWKYNEKTNTYMPQTSKQVYSWGNNAEGSAYWQAPGTGHTSAKERSMVQQGIQDAMDAKDWDLLSTYVSPTHTQASTHISGLTPAVTGDKTATPLDERTNALNAEINAAQNAQNNVLPVNTPPAEYAQGGIMTDPPQLPAANNKLLTSNNPMGQDTIMGGLSEGQILQIRNNERSANGLAAHSNYAGDVVTPANQLPGTPAAATPTYEEAMQMRSYAGGGSMTDHDSDPPKGAYVPDVIRSYQKKWRPAPVKPIGNNQAMQDGTPVNTPVPVNNNLTEDQINELETMHPAMFLNDITEGPELYYRDGEWKRKIGRNGQSLRNGGRMQILPSFITPSSPDPVRKKFEGGGFGVGEPQTSGFQNTNLDTGQQDALLDPMELSTANLAVDGTDMRDNANAAADETGPKRNTNQSFGFFSGINAMGNEIIDNTWDDPRHGKNVAKESVMQAQMRAGQGADIGMKIGGPWGMLIGAAAGTVGGAIEGGVGAKKANEAYSKEFMENYQKMQNADDGDNLFARDGGYLKNGGKLPFQYNEGYMNDTYNEYNGNKHEQGGILIGQDSEVETGEVRWNDYIFSDSLQPSNKFKV